VSGAATSTKCTLGAIGKGTADLANDALPVTLKIVLRNPDLVPSIAGGHLGPDYVPLILVLAGMVFTVILQGDPVIGVSRIGPENRQPGITADDVVQNRFGQSCRHKG
jgi:hypothetical protein